MARGPTNSLAYEASCARACATREGSRTMTVSDSTAPVLSPRLDKFGHDLAMDKTAACTALRTDLEAAGGPLLEPLPDGNVLVTFVFEAAGGDRVSVYCHLWPGEAMARPQLSQIAHTDFWYPSLV